MNETILYLPVQCYIHIYVPLYAPGCDVEYKNDAVYGIMVKEVVVVGDIACVPML